MQKIILVQSSEDFYQAFQGETVCRAEPGDMLVLTSMIVLDRDLTLDVPVTIVLEGKESGINCNGNQLRVELKAGKGTGQNASRRIEIKRLAIKS